MKFDSVTIYEFNATFVYKEKGTVKIALDRALFFIHHCGILSLVDRNVLQIAFADVFGAWANEFVVGVLFEDVAGPA